VYELFGQNFAGTYLFMVYRRTKHEQVVFHMSEMTDGEKKFYRGEPECQRISAFNVMLACLCPADRHRVVGAILSSRRLIPEKKEIPII
jgi:hypothetical protein